MLSIDMQDALGEISIKLDHVHHMHERVYNLIFAPDNKKDPDESIRRIWRDRPAADAAMQAALEWTLQLRDTVLGLLQADETEVAPT